MTHEFILDFLKKYKKANELASVLNSYSVNFAYNSSKIENDEITYHDTREVFDKDGVTSYTCSTKEIKMILTNGTYDERRYLIGERPGEYKHHDYVTGKSEVGALVDDKMLWLLLYIFILNLKIFIHF